MISFPKNTIQVEASSRSILVCVVSVGQRQLDIFQVFEKNHLLTERPFQFHKLYLHIWDSPSSLVGLNKIV